MSHGPAAAVYNSRALLHCLPRSYALPSCSLPLRSRWTTSRPGRCSDVTVQGTNEPADASFLAKVSPVTSFIGTEHLPSQPDAYRRYYNNEFGSPPDYSGLNPRGYPYLVGPAVATYTPLPYTGTAPSPSPSPSPPPRPPSPPPPSPSPSPPPPPPSPPPPEPAAPLGSDSGEECTCAKPQTLPPLSPPPPSTLPPLSPLPSPPPVAEPAATWGTCGGVGHVERDCASASDICYKHSPGYWQCRPLDLPPPLSDAEAAAARGEGVEGELDAAQERPVDAEIAVQAEEGVAAQEASSADSVTAAGAFWAAMAASLVLGVAIGALAAPAWRMCHSAAPPPPTRKPAAVTVKNEQQYLPSQPSI